MFSMFLGLFLINILLLFIGLVTIRFAAKLIMVPMTVIVPTVLLLSVTGIYATSNSLFSVGVLLALGGAGIRGAQAGLLDRAAVDRVRPGPHPRNSLRQSITIADGNIVEFFNTPIGLGIYAALILTILWGELMDRVRNRRAEKVENS